MGVVVFDCVRTTKPRLLGGVLLVAGVRNQQNLPQATNKENPRLSRNVYLPNHGEVRDPRYHKRFDLLFNAYDITDTYLRNGTD